MLRLALTTQRVAQVPLARRGVAASEAWARTLCTKAEAKPAEAADAEPGKAAGADAGAEEPAARIAALEQKVSELDEQLKSKHDQMLRALAEADNARRRAAIDVQNANKYAVGGFAKDLIDVADNLGRAAEFVPMEMRTSDDHKELKSLYEGVVLTDATLLKIFAKHGMTKVEPLGAKFDPNFHNAMFEAPDPDREPGTVMHVTAPGYLLHDRCLRAAGVGVTQKR